MSAKGKLFERKHRDNDGDWIPEFDNGRDTLEFAVPDGYVFSHYELKVASTFLGDVKVVGRPRRGSTGLQKIRVDWNYGILGHADYKLTAWARERNDGFPPVHINFGSPNWDVRARSLFDQKYPVKIVVFGDLAEQLATALGLNHRQRELMRDAGIAPRMDPITIGIIAGACIAIAGLGLMGLVLTQAMAAGYGAKASINGRGSAGEVSGSFGLDFDLTPPAARDDSVNSTEDFADHQTRPANLTRPRKVALCVGINDYPGVGSDLSGCVNDAKDWKNALDQRGFDTRLLLDSKATLRGMEASIRDVVHSANRGDLVVITYSGHGSWIPDVDGDEADARDEVLCPYDIGTNGALSDDRLYELFEERAPGVRVVMISDSCHSGSVNRAQAEGIRRFLPPGTFLTGGQLEAARSVEHLAPRLTPRPNGGLLWAGCQDSQFSYDATFNGRPNGAFTYFALRALGSLSANSTYNDWHRAVRQNLPSGSYPQNPVLTGPRSLRGSRVLV